MSLSVGYLTCHERFPFHKETFSVWEMSSRKGQMKEAALLAFSEGIEIDQIQITEAGLVVSVIATHPQSCCPLCLQPSSHINSHCHRTLKDAPCVGRQLQLSL